MKLTISVELDLSEAPGYNIENLDGMRGSLQNLGSWLSNLNLYNHERMMRTFDIDDLVMREAVQEAIRQDTVMSEQLFNNYRVEGTTDDGHTFTFSHREPGYVERMFVDGKLVED